MNNKYFIAGIKRNKQVKINYELFGNGQEKVIFLTGILSSISTWKHQIKYLIDNHPQYQIGCFHYRGIGNSEYSKTNGIRDYSMDLEDYLDHLKWDKVHIVSTSFGSQVAYDFALYSPHRIKSLLLSSMKPPYKNYIAECSLMMDSINKKDLKTFQELFFSNDFLNSKDENNQTIKLKINNSLTKILDERSSIPKEVIYDQFKSTFNFIITDQDKLILNEREFPISIISASNDALFPIKDSLSLVSFIKPESFSILNGCGHGIPNERLNDFNHEMDKSFNLLKRDNSNNKSEFTLYNNIFKNNNKNSNNNNNNNKIKYNLMSNNKNNNSIRKLQTQLLDSIIQKIESPNIIHNNKYSIGLKFLKNFNKFK